MRVSVASLRWVVKRDLPIEFVPQALTSYGGLELLRRYLQRVDLPGRLRRTLATLGSDYGSARLSLLVLALLYVGGRRPEHLRYVAGDPLVRRFCGLARVPTARTVGNWLRQFSRRTLAALSRLNHEVVTDAISRLELPRLTIDLFTPDDGHFEYHAVATKLSLSLPALFAFIAGRGAQEKTIAELKGEFALDVVPTKDYTANSAWQPLSILAHNVARSLQLDTLAEPKPRSRKRTYAYLFRSMRTLRFLLITRAGRLTRIGGRQVLRLAANPATETLYGRIAQRLAA
jgi:hypothetical protein